MQLVILAGGKGTRLRSKLGDLPKPLAPVGGKPLLEHHLAWAQRNGCDDVVLLVGHGGEAIAEWAGDGSKFGLPLRLIMDRPARGTAGAVLSALPYLQSRFAVLYGDTMLNVDLARFQQAHAAGGGAVSLLVHPNDHPFDSDLVETDASGLVAGFRSPPHEEGVDYQNQVNAGLYLVERDPLATMPLPEGITDFGRNLLPAMLARGYRLFAYRSPEYIKDAGTPERLDAVNADWESGRISRGSLATCAPAIFLDRDGTINREAGYLRSPGEVELLEGSAAAIRTWNRAGWRVVVVTNQPVIARGECSEEQMQAIHNRLETLLGRQGAYVDAIYYCPHHPAGGFPGERAELKMACECRKPAPGMIHQAARELNLDLSRSWMIGDRISDIQAARNAGAKAILVLSGRASREDVAGDPPDAIAENLTEAVRHTGSPQQGASR